MAYKKKNYCPSCGEKVVPGADSCPKCGCQYDLDRCFPGVPAFGAGGVGWSPVTGEEPCFVRYRKEQNRKSLKMFLYGGIFALIIGVITEVYALTHDEMPVLGLLVFLAIMFVYLLIYLYSRFTNRAKASFEGTVTDKSLNAFSQTSHDKDRGNRTRYYVEYKIVFALQGGGQKKYKDTYETASLIDQNNPADWPPVYRYVQQGELVRFHGKLHYFEKYDKTREDYIPCAACGESVDARAGYCSECGCLLFKGTQAAAAQPYQTMAQPQGMAQSQQFAQPQQFAQMQQPQGIAQCPRCGSMLSPGSSFCPGCGTQLV